MALAYSAEAASAAKAGQPWSLLCLQRTPPKRVLLRQGFGGHPLSPQGVAKPFQASIQLSHNCEHPVIVQP